MDDDAAFHVFVGTPIFIQIVNQAIVLVRGFRIAIFRFRIKQEHFAIFHSNDEIDIESVDADAQRDLDAQAEAYAKAEEIEQEEKRKTFDIIEEFDSFNVKTLGPIEQSNL